MMKVDCPECGQKIDKRGYPSHMHHSHGVPYDDQPEPGNLSGISEKVGRMVTKDQLVEQVALAQEKALRHVFFEECDDESHQRLRERFGERVDVELPVETDANLAQPVTEPPECLMEEFREAEEDL